MKHIWRVNFIYVPNLDNNIVITCFLSNILNIIFNIFTSTSFWKSNRSILCQLDPSKAKMFQDFETWAHLHRDTTSKYENILNSNSLGNFLFIIASSSLNTLFNWNEMNIKNCDISLQLCILVYGKIAYSQLLGKK